jgi:hypothetical protein
MSVTPEVYPISAGESTLVLYDLRDPEAWKRAGRERAGWSNRRAKVHAVGLEHIVIEYMAGGALELVDE